MEMKVYRIEANNAIPLHWILFETNLFCPAGLNLLMTIIYTVILFLSIFLFFYFISFTFVFLLVY